VGLPASQQRVLDGIEDDLRGCEPRLASMFSIFTRLTRDEGAPTAEPLPLGARRWRTWPGPELAAALGTMIIVPLVLGLVALFVLMAASSGGHGCRSGAASHSAVTSRALGCQSAPEPPGHGS
jgi:hypothetical protein